jgi:hypothetical protein
MELQKYPKFKENEDCAFPERDNCNWDDNPGSTRCPYMKCICMGNWHCIYEKNPQKRKIG